MAIVAKTLVIGLGSSGTRICNFLAERLRWELGSLNAAPWVKFLCIETDETEPTPLSERGDFLTVSISKEEFSRIVNDPGQFANDLLHNDWADIATLRKLPDQAITKGAGNMRMAGRLTFLFRRCLDDVIRAINKRTSALDEIDGQAATQAQEIGADGQQRQIEFYAGPTTVFVVGTLCGGTCSGLASDFGLFLSKVLPQNYSTNAIFTLPHHQLNPANVTYAERYKVNAFHALTELNFYSAVDANDKKREVRFQDGMYSNPGQSPYEMVLLATPRSPDIKSEKDLNEAIGDYLFLRIMAPDIQPGGPWADVSKMAKGGIYPAFCTFGFASLEYPARRIMEACSARLLYSTIGKYRERSSESHIGLIEQGIAQLGINWDSLQQAFLESSASRNLQTRLKGAESDLVRNVSTSIEEARRSLHVIRDAFEQTGAESVSKVLSDSRNEVVARIKANLRNVARKWLSDYEIGPSPLIVLCDRAIAHLDDLVAQDKNQDENKSKGLDRLMIQVASIHENGLIGLMLLRNKAIERLKMKLRNSVAEEISMRMRGEILTQLKDPIGSASGEDGVVAQIRKELLAVRKRLDNLSFRLLELKNGLEKQYLDIASSSPNVNGICMFDKGMSESDTVPRAYRSALEHERTDATEPWTNVENRNAAKIIAAWDTLPAAVAPEIPLAPRLDWLYDVYLPSPGSKAIPEKDLDLLELAASRPFKILASADVLSRWFEENDSDAERVSVLKSVNQATTPFLNADLTIAPVTEILRSQDSMRREEFDAKATVIFDNAKYSDSPDSFRAVVISHYLGFPLTAVPHVVQVGGLADATCHDFPTFHTRRDIDWFPLPRRSTEHQDRAAAILAVGLLLELVELRDQDLLFKGKAEALGSAPTLRIKANIAAGGKILEKGSIDQDGNSTRGALQLLETRIGDFRKNKCGDGDSNSNDRTFVVALRKALEDKVGGNVSDAQNLRKYATAFCAEIPELRRALIATGDVDTAEIQSLLVREGEKRAGGRVAAQDGLYCSECGGWIGDSKDSAANAGWVCQENSQHYFGPIL